MDNKIKIVKSNKSWIESNAVEQLIKVTNLEGVLKGVGLPDLHAGKTPAGASFITKDIIYPHIIGNDIGCGMGIFSTGIKKNKFKLDKIIKKLDGLNGIENISIEDFLEKTHLPFKEKLGTIGGGNHFAELQEIDEVYDNEELDSISMNKSIIYLLVHSGSRSYGESILRKFIEDYSCQDGLYIGSDAFNKYMADHERALEFAKLNRELIAYRILKAIGAKDNQKILDSVHNGISKKEIDSQEHYIHRKGTAPSDEGCVIVAGSRGTKSYIVKPYENLYDYAFSISHGSGRKWSRFGCKEKLENMYSKKSVRQNKLVYNLIYKDKSVVYEEAPEAYKNIENVIEDMVNENMIKVVASLNPLITYKV
ncbi:release factor H-coupled RctB family protein [Gottschalkia acidurici 9a]|uniref:3'-phosphate/5'-hydroxy nucleic acid ligase n=1 Tax=Gottschalkia acidurici (strain ATCC 7906 / DSM 604 / BCRC 14475 / CIP 104303 / KCTC 5404 / NCIMB 10678 / 9a) TaxID=1128398 RepID=K0AWH9_GOTA9|nr:RNA ligase RtcB family protein [Gottschalkia acidurici]AFS77589.1 release factor H-coupled RctB family protein [Gottschalkia acidurici 9a]